MSQGYPRPSLNTSRKILGFGVPPQQLGIGASFRYKDFNASFLVEGKLVVKSSLVLTYV